MILHLSAAIDLLHGIRPTPLPFILPPVETTDHYTITSSRISNDFILRYFETPPRRQYFEDTMSFGML